MTYISRKLQYIQDKNLHSINDFELLTLNRSVIVLAEPGMGKTALLDELSKYPNVQKINASSFVRKPKKLLTDNNDVFWLIDALDEMPSKQEGGNIDAVLQKLYDLGLPKFILTCRNIEWQSINNQAIQDYYGNNLIQANLLPFNRDCAYSFLTDSLSFRGDANELLNNLDSHNLASYYENPLTLELLVNSNSEKLPENKAEIFEIALQHLWQESNDNATNELKKFGQDFVLTYAGYIFATYLLAGKQQIFIGNTSKTPIEALNTNELDNSKISLMEILKSRLFKATGDAECYIPWHRTIAEFLGAKWLAEQMVSPMIRQRIFAQLIVDNGVVASLRGLFTWLSYFNMDLAKIVINTDPYGMIKYAETSHLTDAQSKLLFQALSNLTDENPWFRQDNWDWIKAKGLAKSCLLEYYRQILLDKESNFNFRSTLIEVLQDADFVDELKVELELIVVESGRHYHERWNTLLLLQQKKACIDWPKLFDTLISSKEHESLRLVFEFAFKYGFDKLSDKQILDAEINSHDFEDKGFGKRHFVPENGTYYYFTKFPIDRISTLLTGIYETIKSFNLDKYFSSNDTVGNINELIIFLIRRFLSESVDKLDADLFAKSISIFYRFELHYSSLGDDYTRYFEEYFLKHLDYKFAILRELILLDSNINNIYQLHGTILHVLFPTIIDTEKLILFIQTLEKTEQNIGKWKELLSFARNKEGISENLYNIALPYAQSNESLILFLNKLIEPIPMHDWQIKNKKNTIRWRRRKSRNRQRYRNYLRSHVSKLEQGDARFCEYPANLLFRIYTDNRKALNPFGKLQYVLKNNLAESARKGFEASLHNQKLSITDIVNCHIDRKVYPVESVLMAGIYNRIIHNQAIDALSDNMIIICGVILDFGHYAIAYQDSEQIIHDTVREQILSRNLKEKFINALIEPQFEKKARYVNGLHWLVDKNGDFEIEKIIYLLDKYPNMDNQYQRPLIETLLKHSSLPRIHALIIQRVNSYEIYEVENLTIIARWFALLSYVDVNLFLKKIQCFELPSEVFWQLSKLFSNEIEVKNFEPSLDILVWLVYRFSHTFPKVERPSGVSSGEGNAWQASDVINSCLSKISKIPSQQARDELISLKDYVHESYQEYIIHLLAQQRVTMREVTYKPYSLNELIAIYEDKSPQNCKDLKALVIQVLQDIQNKIKGSETDIYKVFYQRLSTQKEPLAIPFNENYCRDRLVDLLEPILARYQISCITERDMPDSKRADIVCQNSEIQVPIEIKGQWHPQLYTSMNEQLGDLYLKEYHSQGYGIYLVFWFGSTTTKPLYKIRGSELQPKNSFELEKLLETLIEEKFKQGVEVFVMNVEPS